MQCALASLENDTKVDGETVHPVGPHRAELEARVEGDLLRREGVKVERLQATHVGDRLRYRGAVGVLPQVGESLADTYQHIHIALVPSTEQIKGEPENINFKLAQMGVSSPSLHR